MLTELLAEVWRRATTPQPAPEPYVIAGIAVVALVIVASPAWPAVRMLATITHEGGHALVGLLTGRRLTGIKLNRDTSGVTISKGAPSGPGMVATLLAGYPAPAITGLGAALLLNAGYAVGMLWLAVGLLGLMLLMMRNFYGILVILVVGTAVVLVSWFLSPTWQSWIAYGVCWLLLWSAPRPVVEVARHPERGSDVAQLRRLTRIPTGVWLFGFVTFTVVAVGVGAFLLLPVTEALTALGLR
ncbi:M50 family metallopeptidase [Propionibacteriaceae bacterium Y2011]|uniref:M50 family metallopeptidase n=1 Tax=Microlunatus sp. Y2014 TaxID=3418488 RepID=UPI003B4D6F8D